MDLVARIVYYGLQPLLLVGSYGLWLYLDQSGSAVLWALVATYWILRLCENSFPAHPDWKHSRGERASVFTLSLVCLVSLSVISTLYAGIAGDVRALLPEGVHFSVWPTAWPLLAQVLLIYFSCEFVFYWIHRSMHRYKILWRLSGHAFHHSFKNMQAVNFMASHPLDLLFLALPAVLVSALLGATPGASIGAALLLFVNGFFAHSNVATNSTLIGWFFTTNTQHELHHSNVLHQSNTNYSCNAILWDRLFGTFCDEPVGQTGIGPSEPTLVEKLLLPIKEPDYTTTAPGTTAISR